MTKNSRETQIYHRCNGHSDGWTDRPSYRDAFLTDASKKRHWLNNNRQAVKQTAWDALTKKKKTCTKKKRLPLTTFFQSARSPLLVEIVWLDHRTICRCEFNAEVELRIILSGLSSVCCGRPSCWSSNCFVAYWLFEPLSIKAGELIVLR